MLNWSKQFSILLFLDNNDFPSLHTGYECLLATGLAPVDNNVVTCKGDTDALTVLQELHDASRDWLFGHICYDYKNILEPKLQSGHPVKLDFPLLHFFIPETVCYIDKEQTALTIDTYKDADAIYNAITETSVETDASPIPKLNFRRVIDKDKYLDTIAQLRRHIADGDCYEINFCNEGYCEDVDVAPLTVFSALNKLSPAPFAAYYRLHDKYMLCTSPERYLHKAGNRITSQPMKGTARRDADAEKDQHAKDALRNSIKEQAENVMITDLVRNDLARCSEPSSVQVDELFGIYTFPQVHQMVSTVSGKLKATVPFTDAIRYSFPMGSMTGAPKYKVMQLVEEYEQSRRELFSGTVGYITPDGDFDFSVIIRSLFYNATSKYLCYQTGGAITYDSDAEQEWEETRLKAWALERIFS